MISGEESNIAGNIVMTFNIFFCGENSHYDLAMYLATEVTHESLFSFQRRILPPERRSQHVPSKI
jgi:hypothetical protein